MIPFVNNILDKPTFNEPLALQLFQHQYDNNTVYNQWCQLMKKTPQNVFTISDIPFLPVSFFKTHAIITGDFKPDFSFTSSGTTQTINSHHYINDINIYRKSFMTAFTMFYGDVKDWCIIGLLPSYLERTGSSLIFMVKELIEQSAHPQSGFYLNEFDKLHTTLQSLENAKQKTLLIGVTFALLDFAAEYPMQLKHTTVMETGGMKGRKKEMVRSEVHEILQKQLGVASIHSEYGATELLSQAYSFGNGLFTCPPWMKMLVRDEENPLQVSVSGKGILNIIDLANIESCAFIAVDDAGIVNTDGSFEVWGRIDNSDIRGCSLLVV